MSGNTFDSSNALALAMLGSFVSAFDGEQAGVSTTYTYVDRAAFPAVTAGYGEVVIDAPVTTTVAPPAEYPVVYDAVASLVTVVGAGGTNQVAYAASGGLTYDFNGGSGVVITGNNPVNGVAASGDTIFLDGAGPNFVGAGQGNDTVVVQAGENYVAVGTGANVVFLDGGVNLVATEGDDQIVVGTDSLSALGHSTVSVSGNSTVYGGSGSVLLLNGGGTSFLIPQIDQTTGAALNTGSDTVFGGTGGGAYYGGTDGFNFMLAGEQATTLVGGGGNDSLFAYGGGNDVLQAASGQTYLIGTAGSGDNTYFAQDANAYISGGGGSDVFVLGRGDSTMTAGVGGDQFDFTAGQAGGFNVIYGFKVGIDHVNLFGYDSDNVSAGANAVAQASVNSYGGSTYVVLSDNTEIYFLNTPGLVRNSILG